MPDVYYTCNLLPLELLARTGCSPRWLGDHLQDPGAAARRDALSIHPMTCPYVTSLVAAAEGVLDDGTSGTAESAQADPLVVVPAGCDAMRRLGDLLSAAYPGRVFAVSMPRSSAGGALDTLAADLVRLEAWLSEKAKSAAEPPGVADGGGRETPSSVVKEAPAVDYRIPPRPGGVFVVAGPLTDDSLLRLIGRLGASVSGLESCTSPDRWKPLAAAGGHDVHLGVAREMLELGMCPRRSTADRRDYLNRRLDEAKPASLIYARQSFCDPGAYDAVLVAELAQERGLPYLEIEVGFPFDAGGPLRTRVEAFLEAQLLDDDLLDDALDDELDDDLLDDLIEEE